MPECTTKLSEGKLGLTTKEPISLIYVLKPDQYTQITLWHTLKIMALGRAIQMEYYLAKKIKN